ncbi:hypothetical protein G6F57_015197 [Rhizopus arrhizus]|nr:hypothetical protein G6F57_015197 [Rhizopus arrhizus]
MSHPVNTLASPWTSAFVYVSTGAPSTFLTVPSGAILVRVAPGLGVFLAVAAIGQHATHRQVPGDGGQQVLVIAQCVLGQQVHETRRAEQRPRRRDGLHPHDEDLGQRERHARAHLVFRADELAPQRGFQGGVDAVALEGFGVFSLLQQPVEMGLRRRHRQLRVQPSGIPVAHHGVDLGRRGPEGGLRQKARRLAWGDGHRKPLVECENLRD